MLFLIIVSIIIAVPSFVYWAIKYSKKIPIKNEKKKFEYLKNKFNKLEGSIDEEHKMKIISIEIDEPLNEKENWQVTKIMDGGIFSLKNKSIIIFDKTDRELETKIINN